MISVNNVMTTTMRRPWLILWLRMRALKVSLCEALRLGAWIDPLQM